jgi:two-component system cell cycle sensor histidine kinase/response regulator CckA
VLILYVLLFGIVWQGHRLIERNQQELEGSRRKIQSQRMELLHRIGSSSLHDPDVGTILTRVVGDVRRLLDLPRCVIRLRDDPDRVFEDLEPGFPSTGSRFPDCPSLRVDYPPYERDEKVVIADVRKCECFEGAREDLERIRLMSYLGLPLSVQGRLMGVLFLERGEPHDWTDEEQAAAEAVAGQVAMAVRHAALFREQQDLSHRLLSLMNNVPGVVYRGLPDWTLPLVGADIERIIGYTAKEFTQGGLKWKDLIHPDDVEAIRNRIRKAVRTKERVLRLEYRLVSKSGEERWVSDRRQMLYDEHGRLAWVDGLCLDITARKKSEEALRLTQFSVDRAGDATYWMGPDGLLIYVNEQLCRALGYSREELLGAGIHLINPDFPPEVWPAHWENLRRRKSYTFESRHRARDGRIIPVEITVNYIEFDGKEYNCASARDITERLRVQEESRQLQAQLLQSQKMEALGILAGGIAHDFNNLLTGILGYADLLGHGGASADDVAGAAAVIRNAAERASQLTSQLLGFARKGKNLAVPVDMNAAIGDVLALLDRTIDKRVRIAHSFRAAPASVVGDPTQLQQVVMNLVMNGAEAMPGGGDLEVSTENVTLDEAFCRAHPGSAPGRYVLVTVHDTGVGIPPENLERIFDPFFTTKERGKGTGLGLSMVFGIVKNHGGYVDLRSRVGEGTTFKAYLPAYEGDPAPADGRAAAASPIGAGRGKVLLIDDQEAVRDVGAAMLRALGYGVVTASDGREGVDIYRETWKETDLVIVDMIMPNLGGRDCFRIIRTINPGVRAILSTGYSMEGTVQEIMKEGMLGFIQKPYRLDQLAEVVGRAIGRGDRPVLLGCADGGYRLGDRKKDLRK